MCIRDSRDPSGFHEYHIFQAEGQKFMVLSLSWRISDAGLAWANQVIRANPTLPVILVNHQLLNIDKDGVTPLEVPYGRMPVSYTHLDVYKRQQEHRG